MYTTVDPYIEAIRKYKRKCTNVHEVAHGYTNIAHGYVEGKYKRKCINVHEVAHGYTRIAHGVDYFNIYQAESSWVRQGC